MRAIMIFVIGLGIAAMFTAEIWPDLFYWTPALAIGFLRAYVIINTPQVRKYSTRAAKSAMWWVWGTTVLISGYVAILWIREAITLDMMFSLQTLNILLVGGEWYFAHLYDMRETPEKLELQALREEYDRYKTEIAGQAELLTQAQSAIDEKLQIINSQRIQIEDFQAEREANSRDLIAVANLIRNPIAISNQHKLTICPECREPVVFGNAAKSVIHCNVDLLLNHKAPKRRKKALNGVPQI